MFNTTLFEEILATSWLGRSFYYLKELDSTNRYAKESEAEHGALILTDRQNSGRGQYQRVWKSEGEKNLTFSLILVPRRTDRLNLLTLAFALSAADAASGLYRIPLRIKWPNDLMAGGYKTGGILTETQYSGSEIKKLILGMGLNVNQTTFPADLRNDATSLGLNSNNGKLNREQLLASILQHFEYRYRQWYHRSSDLAKEINSLLIGAGEMRRLSINGEETDEALEICGVDDSGYLKVIAEGGQVRRYTFEQVRILE